ncbi:MAG: hypothetical protein ACTSU5_00575 [Promethearchaeota archaeon]
MDVKEVEGTFEWPAETGHQGPIPLKNGTVVSFRLSGFRPTEVIAGVSNAADEVALGDIELSGTGGASDSVVENLTSVGVGLAFSLTIGNWTGGLLSSNNWLKICDWCNNSIDRELQTFRVDDNGYTIRLGVRASSPGGNSTELVYERSSGKCVRANITRVDSGGTRHLLIQATDANSVPGVPLPTLLLAAIISVSWVALRGRLPRRHVRSSRR